MTSRTIPEKIKKKIYQESLMICPMCGESDVTTFELHHIQSFSEVMKHEEDNLILLCSNCHSKVTFGTISEAEVLRLKLCLVKGKHPFAKSSNVSNVISIFGGSNSGIIANTVKVQSVNTSIKFSPPEESIASSLNHRNYVKYLIDRYHQFKMADIGKAKMNYKLIYVAISREFGSKWDMVPISRFEKLTRYIQTRIEKTILGKNSILQGNKCYSNYIEYLEKHNR